jgi:hypothetical protein
MSMTFYAGTLIGGLLTSVFDRRLLTEGTWVETPCGAGDLLPNPDYRPELDINLANGNASGVLACLGYDVEDGMFDAPIDEFLGRIAKATHPHQYVVATFGRLETLAELGKAAGATHIYGG